MSALKRGVSNIGKNAEFGTPDEEIARILKFKTNYYICLKVLPDTDAAEIRANYLKLSRKVHPDKCPGNPNAADASSVLNTAKDTLTNPMKKKLYDAYVIDVTAAGGGAGGEGPEMSYADWEAAQSAYPVRLPKWLEKVLSIPLLGQCIAILIIIILIPLLLCAVLIGLCLYCLCLPFNLLARCFCAPPSPGADAEAEREAFADAAPKPQTATRGADAV